MCVWHTDEVYTCLEALSIQEACRVQQLVCLESTFLFECFRIKICCHVVEYRGNQRPSHANISMLSFILDDLN